MSPFRLGSVGRLSSGGADVGEVVVLRRFRPSSQFFDVPPELAPFHFGDQPRRGLVAP